MVIFENNFKVSLNWKPIHNKINMQITLFILFFDKNNNPVIMKTGDKDIMIKTDEINSLNVDYGIVLIAITSNHKLYSLNFIDIKIEEISANNEQKNNRSLNSESGNYLGDFSRFGNNINVINVSKINRCLGGFDLTDTIIGYDIDNVEDIVKQMKPIQNLSNNVDICSSIFNYSLRSNDLDTDDIILDIKKSRDNAILSSVVEDNDIVLNPVVNKKKYLCKIL